MQQSASEVIPEARCTSYLLPKTTSEAYASLPKVDAELPVYTANCLQRWALILLLNISTANFGYADFLSRLLSSQRRLDVDYVIAALNVEFEATAILDGTTSNLPITHKMIVAETGKDPVVQ